MSIQLPPQPNPHDFHDDDSNFEHLAFNAALQAWERVCKAIIEAGKVGSK